MQNGGHGLKSMCTHHQLPVPSLAPPFRRPPQKIGGLVDYSSLAAAVPVKEAPSLAAQ